MMLMGKRGCRRRVRRARGARVLELSGRTTGFRKPGGRESPLLGSLGLGAEVAVRVRRM
jgi:hypothetical protein